MIGTNPQVLTDLRDLVDCIYSYPYHTIPYHTHVENIAMYLKQLTTIEGTLAKMSRSSWKEFFWFVGGQCENKIRLKLEERCFCGDSRVPSSASHQEAVEKHQYCL